VTRSTSLRKIGMWIMGFLQRSHRRAKRLSNSFGKGTEARHSPFNVARALCTMSSRSLLAGLTGPFAAEGPNTIKRSTP